MTSANNKPSEDNVISISEAKSRIKMADITQDELAVLARLQARRRGLSRATKCVRSNVSMFFSRNLPNGHIFDAVKYAAEEYLGVEIDVNLDVA